MNTGMELIFIDVATICMSWLDSRGKGECGILVEISNAAELSHRGDWLRGSHIRKFKILSWR